MVAEQMRDVHDPRVLDALSRVPRHLFVPERARCMLADLGRRNVEIRTGDGYGGWPEQAPFDRILGTAAPKDVPHALVDQLADGGVLVLPVGDWNQDVHVIRKQHGGIQSRSVLPVRFVPMVRPRGGRDGA